MVGRIEGIILGHKTDKPITINPPKELSQQKNLVSKAY